jgi:branched-chain amino acid transport system ATP-binding protein
LAAPLLEVRGISASYGALRAIDDVSLELHAGELLLLAGPNGAGKSTLMRVLVGLHRPDAGSIALERQAITGWSPNRRARAGLAWIPEGRGVIPELTVEENLDLARFGKAWTPRRRAEILERFPVLGRSLGRPAGTLSGGEQQMLALGRALASGPHLLLVDEPSLGLAPLIVHEVMSLLKQLREEGHSILLVEQRAAQVEHVASRILLMRQGRISDAPPHIEFTEMDFAHFIAGESSPLEAAS